MIWLNGELVAEDEARVSVFDHGLTVGDGVFETMRVYDGTPFALRRHLDRMERSAAVIGLRLPARAILHRAVTEVIAANDPALERLRLTVTGGVAPLGSERAGSPSTVVAAVGPLAPVPPSTAVITVPWVRNERSALAGVKSTSYAENVVALARATAAGASEALFANTRGELCEGTGTNVFVVVDGRLVTPPLSSGCLAGVTRELVLELCDITEAPLPHEVLLEAEEVFLTSSTREVQQVERVDDRSLTATGARTSEVAHAYRALTTRDLDP